MKRGFTGFLILTVFVLSGFFILTDVTSAADIIIDRDTVWGNGDVITINANKYLGESGMHIMPGVTLTVNAGAIIKLFPNNSIIVEGNLIISGVSNNPAIITSIKDDSAGGDTNEDDNATVPAQGDWGAIKIMNTGNVVIDYAVIAYGGARDNPFSTLSSMINIENQRIYNLSSSLWAKTIISNSLITESAGYGIYDKGIYTVITKNKIFKNNSYGIRFEPDVKNEITYNDINLNGFNGPGSYWGGGILMIRNGIQLNISRNNFHNNTFGFVNTSGVSISLINNWWGSDQGPIVCSSYCIKSGERDSIVGLAAYQPFLTEEWKMTTKPDPVIIIPGILGSWNFGFGWELDPIFHTYDNLWSALKLAGYKEGVDLFAFPYNWRLSNVYNAIELKAKIDEVKAICNCERVDVIGHSMGGLVARAYVEMGNYDNDIDQLIFLATPHRGSPDSYLMWEGGELGQTARDFIYERLLKVEGELNGYGDVYSYVRQLPMQSIAELLPIYNYLKDKNTNGSWQIRYYPNNYPRNLFLELLNHPSQLAKLVSIDITNIVADNGVNNTISYLKVIEKDFIDGQWEHGYPENFNSIFGDQGIGYGSGDGTVSSYSNSGVYNFNTTVVSSSHNSVVTDAQKLVIKKLTSNEPNTEVRKNIFSKYLLIRIFSPADFLVTAPDGQRVGKDFVSNNVLNEIEGAFYTGFDGDIEFVLIPNPIDGEYKIELQGTGNGEYKLSTSLIDNDQAIDSNYDGAISLADRQDFKLSLEANILSDLTPAITNLDELIEAIEDMFQKGWLHHFGSKNALVSQLKNGFKNDKQFKQLNKFVDNMLDKNRINQPAYDIIKSALINIKNNL